MKTRVQDILQKFPDLIRLHRGLPDTQIAQLQSPPLAKADTMIFVGTAPILKEALESKSQIWLTSPELLEGVPEHVPVVLVSGQVPLALAMISQSFFPQTQGQLPIAGERIHPSANISKSAVIGENCIIGPGAMIGDYCHIGARTVIGSNAVIEPHVRIGEDTHVHPLVYIGHSCEIGNRCWIKPNTSIGTEGYGYAQDKGFNHYRIAHYGRVVLEDDVHIGAGVQLDRGTFADTRIGRGTKIDNHCHFGHNFIAGRNNLITGGFLTAGSVTIGSNCVFGGRSSAKGHLTVTDNVHLAAMSAIPNDITEPGQYGGHPLQPIKDEMKTRAAIKQLPELAKQVRQIMKHLGLSS